jgi:hypothetical protein
MDHKMTDVPAQGMEDDAAFAALGMTAVQEPVTSQAPVAPEVQQDQPEPGAQAPATAEPASKGWDGREKATALLSTYGHVPKSVLDATSDADLQKWSSEYQAAETKTKTEIQRRSEEVKQLRDELGHFKSQPETPAKVDPRKGPTPDADLEAELKPLVDELRDAGVPAGEKLAAVLKSHLRSTSDRADVSQQVASELGEFFVEQARSQLAAQYPQLSDDEVFTKVREEAEAHLRTGRYEGIPFRKAVSSALSTAAKVVLFDDIVKSHAEQVQSNNRARLSEQPTAPTRQQQPKPMTPEEREDRIADLILAGKSEEARRLAIG